LSRSIKGYRLTVKKRPGAREPCKPHPSQQVGGDRAGKREADRRGAAAPITAEDEESFIPMESVRACFRAGGGEYRVDYLSAESNTGMFGGNSNWRGPIWMPVNVMLIRALIQLYVYYGDNFKVECPTGTGNLMNLFDWTQRRCLKLDGLRLSCVNSEADQPRSHPHSDRDDGDHRWTETSRIDGLGIAGTHLGRRCDLEKVMPIVCLD